MMQWGNDGNMPNRNGSDRIISWLTGYGPDDLETILEDGASLKSTRRIREDGSLSLLYST